MSMWPIRSVNIASKAQCQSGYPPMPHLDARFMTLRPIPADVRGTVGLLLSWRRSIHTYCADDCPTWRTRAKPDQQVFHKRSDKLMLRHDLLKKSQDQIFVDAKKSDDFAASLMEEREAIFADAKI
jgi:hypothetical protein